MSATANRSRDSKRIAVIRSYQPIRIERELLAQVFNLAERGPSDASADASGQRAAVDHATELGTKDPTQHGLQDQRTSQQVDELEAVA